MTQWLSIRPHSVIQSTPHKTCRFLETRFPDYHHHQLMSATHWRLDFWCKLVKLILSPKPTARLPWKTNRMLAAICKIFGLKVINNVGHPDISSTCHPPFFCWLKMYHFNKLRIKHHTLNSWLAWFVKNARYQNPRKLVLIKMKKTTKAKNYSNYFPSNVQFHSHEFISNNRYERCSCMMHPW